MRLNSWQQIGALASVFWVLAGPVYLINKDTHHATKQASLAKELDRVVELGYLVERLSRMCGPHLMLLHESDFGKALGELSE